MLRRTVSLFLAVYPDASRGIRPACLGITKEFNQTYPLQPGGTFELQNVNGPWTCKAGTATRSRSTR